MSQFSWLGLGQGSHFLRFSGNFAGSSGDNNDLFAFSLADRPGLFQILPKNSFKLWFTLSNLTLLATVKDRFINILLWKVIGADGVGIIGWAQTWSQKPLRFIMDNVTRVTFPSFSRLQDHPAELKNAIEKNSLFISLATFPLLAGLVTVSPLLIKIIPKYPSGNRLFWHWASTVSTAPGPVSPRH